MTEKLPGSTKIFDYEELMENAKSGGRIIDEDQLEHAYKIINFNEYIIDINQEKLVADRIKKLGLTESYNQIIFEWEILKKPVSELCRYLTPIFISEEGYSLLDKCLKNAVEQYELKTNEMLTKGTSVNLPAQLTSFITGLSKPLSEILSHKLYGYIEDGDKWVGWKTLEQPIYDWMRQNQFEQLLIVPDPIYSRDQAFLARMHIVHNIFGYLTLSNAKFDWKLIIQNEIYN